MGRESTKTYAPSGVGSREMFSPEARCFAHTRPSMLAGVAGPGQHTPQCRGCLLSSELPMCNKRQQLRSERVAKVAGASRPRCRPIVLGSKVSHLGFLAVRACWCGRDLPVVIKYALSLC